MTKSQLVILSSLLAVALIAPFIAGFSLSGANQVFGGFLLNPYDGNSYLAKMRIGFQGDWLFQLPYTAEMGEGAYLFLFYILLGHIARITTLSLPAVFHLARLLCAAFLVYALLRFLHRTLKIEESGALSFIVGLLFFGSGLGWVAGPLGSFTSDFWVAEAFPFLSMFSNPHFSLGLGLLLLFFDSLIGGIQSKHAIWMLPLGLLTAIIQPFAVVVGVVVAGLRIIWEYLETRKLIILPVLYFMIGGASLLIYQYAAILRDPLLSGWNAQNLTPSPPFWDVLVSFSPALILAIVGLALLIRQHKTGQYKLLIIWLAAGLALAYFPFGLQRRFLLGFFIPCAVMAGIGLLKIVQGRSRLYKWLSRTVILLSVITNLFVILGGISGILAREPLLFIGKDEQHAFEWMNSLKGDPGLILASEQTGLFIPAYSSWRVVYGHPFETVDAQQRKNEVNGIFHSWDQVQIANYIVKNQIEYAFWGPREQMSRRDNPFLEYQIAYQNPTVTIFRTGEGR